MESRNLQQSFTIAGVEAGLSRTASHNDLVDLNKYLRIEPNLINNSMGRNIPGAPHNRSMSQNKSEPVLLPDINNNQASLLAARARRLEGMNSAMKDLDVDPYGTADVSRSKLSKIPLKASHLRVNSRSTLLQKFASRNADSLKNLRKEHDMYLENGVNADKGKSPNRSTSIKNRSRLRGVVKAQSVAKLPDHPG